jgi:type IX secretion system PorP/SprF family membrane protein
MLVTLIAGHFVGIGQDNQYSQFYSAQLYLNPAFAGTKVCPRVIMNFRDQWPGISGQYVSYGLSYDQSVGKNSGIGVVFNGDDAGEGTIKTNSINVVFSPKVRLGKLLTLSFALSGGVIQKKLDASNLTYPNQYDENGLIIGVPPEISNDINRITPDFNSGVILYSDIFHLGYSTHHILEPSYILYGPEGKLYRKHTVHLGANFKYANPLNRKDVVKFSPQIVYQQQGPHSELNLGLYVSKKKITGGIWYRGEDALILVVGLQQRSFNFGFSYDATISKLANNTAGSIEVSMGYVFPCRSKHKRIRLLDCPSF